MLWHTHRCPDKKGAEETEMEWSVGRRKPRQKGHRSQERKGAQEVVNSSRC